MSLNITLTYSGTGYALKAEVCTHSFTRFPTVTPLPADASGNPQVFSLDLGMSLEQFNIQGTVDSTGSGTNPSKSNMETICRNWWVYGDTATALPVLSVDTGQNYYVHLKNADFVWEGAQEDRWRMTIVFLVRQKQ